MPEGATTHDVAAKIGPGLARSAVAGKILDGDDEHILDLHRPLPGDCRLNILTRSDDDPDALSVLRHSAAHVMAEAVCKLFPDTKLVYGPSLEDGFYYDIDLPVSITPDDFPRIEQEMQRIVKEDRKFRRVDMSRAAGMAKLAAEGSRYKLDNAERAKGDTLSFYITGEDAQTGFQDLCRGPHVPSTGVIKAFKVKGVSRSYYRGDMTDQPLQRIHGTAFFKKESLKDYLERVEQAKARDHRVLGKELGLFHVDEMVGQGLILWTPAGAVVRKELETFISKELRRQGYDEVFTPHIGKLDLFRASGHFPYYKASQYPPSPIVRDEAKPLIDYLVKCRSGREDWDEARERDLVRRAGIREDAYPWSDKDISRRVLLARQMSLGGMEGCSCAEIANKIDRDEVEGYLLKPMNCPHHIKIYSSRPHSYRDLPVRLAEFGTVYRWEQSGELSGMIRVRGFTQDDAHLFCTPGQVAAELLGCLELVNIIFTTLGMENYRVRLGLRGPDSDKYVGEPADWDKAEQACRQAARSLGVPFSEEVDEAAFYGPKVDFITKDCIGRSWQLGTVQVDYNLPERFDLTYIGRDNRPHRPIMIHRAPFGSMERFVGVLIEHFAGAFPLWLSPVQAAVATVSEKSADYGRRVFRTLKQAGLRAELDVSDEKIGPKKHRLRASKVNYILVVGETEAADGGVNVNDRDGHGYGNMSLEAFIAACEDEIGSKASTSAFATQLVAG